MLKRILSEKLERNSPVHERPKCDTHGDFCLIFGNIVLLTDSSMLISKITGAKLNSCVKVVFWYEIQPSGLFHTIMLFDGRL